MKEIFNWVPWFVELSQKIAENDEDFLAQKARQIPWKEDGGEIPLLQYGDDNIDPFSFIYTLAGYQFARKRIYAGVSEVFGLTSELLFELDDLFIFPTPQLTNVLFHPGDGGDPDLLWRLFRSTVKGIDQVSADEFDSALQIKRVGPKKLTQALFLVNPNDFLPYDDRILSLGVSDALLGKETWENYRNEIKKVRDMFPGCTPYEINVLVYESSKSKSPLKVNPERCFQISTNVYNDNEDRWEDFSENCWVYTGGPGTAIRLYALTDPEKGDIILVRFAAQGHGIGVVYRNDYREGFAEEARLHVLWMNKKEAKLSSGHRALGFSRGDGVIGTAFQEAYPETFQILDRMKKEPNGPIKPHNDEETADARSVEQKKQRALNTILCGPPGTGKTYATARRSVEICDGEVPDDREELRERYTELTEEERIVFVTFHQSYGYEEFVEGLRPVAANSQGGGMRLRVKDGVLKRIAGRARQASIIGARRIFKMALGDPKSSGGREPTDALFGKCIDEGCVFLEYGGEIDWSDARYNDGSEILKRWRRDRDPTATPYNRDVQAMRRFRVGMRPGHIVVVSDGYEHFRAVGEVTGEYEFHPRADGLHHRRSVRWHWHVRNRQGRSVSVFKHGRFKHGPINLMNPANPAGLMRYLDNDGGRDQPYVLVIDEINRANISKVMGELITLLEEDKREGAENEVTATLPYSDERFTLPSNLYILGTMNTADRSIALLDTALRRRFHFEEISPNPDLLTKAAEQTGVDLRRVLQAINERLEYLVDRDHLIGHAWFMRAKTHEDVNAVMRHKIIPLIAEYFYDDWNKVRAVLGGADDFVKRERLNPPPGLESDTGEERYRWTVRETFAENAYKNLIGAASRDARAE